MDPSLLLHVPVNLPWTDWDFLRNILFMAFVLIMTQQWKSTKTATCNSLSRSRWLSVNNKYEISYCWCSTMKWQLNPQISQFSSNFLLKEIAFSYFSRCLPAQSRKFLICKTPLESPVYFMWSLIFQQWTHIISVKSTNIYCLVLRQCVVQY